MLYTLATAASAYPIKTKQQKLKMHRKKLHMVKSLLQLLEAHIYRHSLEPKVSTNSLKPFV